MNFFKAIGLTYKFSSFWDKAAIFLMVALPAANLHHGLFVKEKPPPAEFIVIAPLALLACFIAACAYVYALHAEARRKQAALKDNASSEKNLR